MLNRRWFFCLLCLLFAPLLYHGQSAEREDSRASRVFSSDIQAGLIAGGQVYNERFIYSSGFMAQASVSREFSDAVGVGLGAGLISLERETYVPLFLDLKARFKQGANKPFLALSMGTSFGSSSNDDQLTYIDLDGGFYFSTCYSFQFPIRNQSRLLLSVAYVHQSGTLEDERLPDDSYDERFSYDFLSIKGGFRF